MTYIVTDVMVEVIKTWEMIHHFLTAFMIDGVHPGDYFRPDVCVEG